MKRRSPSSGNSRSAEVSRGEGGTAGALLDVAANCPRCATPADLQVSEAFADLLAEVVDPALRVGTYRCHKCGAVYDLFAEAYTADRDRDPRDEPQPTPESLRDRRAGGGSDAMAVLEGLIGSVSGPPDWAAEHDHYLYGTPKRAGG